MDELDQAVDDALLALWAAALDAASLAAEPDATEDHYLRKQRHHIDRCKAEIRRAMAGQTGLPTGPQAGGGEPRVEVSVKGHGGWGSPPG